MVWCAPVILNVASAIIIIVFCVFNTICLLVLLLLPALGANVISFQPPPGLNVCAGPDSFLSYRALC